jgi:DNA-binding MarR family transcriptional regulator
MSGRLLAQISEVHLDWKRFIARNLGPYGITPKQVFLLRKLRESGPLLPSDIAGLLHADRPTVAVMLNTLTRRGWIRRRRDPGNARQILVALSSAGQRKLASVPEALWRSGRMPDDPESCFTEAERRQIESLLARLHDRVRACAEG